jgi:hypothetical protein
VDKISQKINLVWMYNESHFGNDNNKNII